jgi:hypothetical protein
MMNYHMHALSPFSSSSIKGEKEIFGAISEVKLCKHKVDKYPCVFVL